METPSPHAANDQREDYNRSVWAERYATALGSDTDPSAGVGQSSVGSAAGPAAATTPRFVCQDHGEWVPNETLPGCPGCYAESKERLTAITPDRSDPLDWYIEVCVICGCQLGPGIGSRTKTGRCVNPDHHQAGGKVVRVMERVA